VNHFSVILIALSACCSLAGPRVCCDAPDFDFGVLDGDSVVRHVFEVANRGDERLKLSVAVACCGAKASLSRAGLEPGEAATATVELPLRGFSGRVEKAVYLGTNDRKTPYLRLGLAGRVAGTVRASPGRLVWEDVPHGQPLAGIVSLECDGRSFSVTNLVSGAGWLKAVLLPPSNGCRRVLVEALPPGLSQRRSANVTVYVDAPPGVIAVPVTVGRPEPLAAFPGEIVLADPPPAEGVSRAVAIRSGHGEAFSIKAVRFEGVRGRYEVKREGKGAWVVHIDGLLPRPGGAAVRRIVVETDHAARRCVAVPVRPPAGGR
jgi:hypothetical protein